MNRCDQCKNWRETLVPGTSRRICDAIEPYTDHLVNGPTIVVSNEPLGQWDSDARLWTPPDFWCSLFKVK